MKRFVKHIPLNSVVLIYKLKTNETKSELVQDETFQLHKAKLDSIAIKKGAECKYFTHPK